MFSNFNNSNLQLINLAKKKFNNRKIQFIKPKISINQFKINNQLIKISIRIKMI